MKIWAWAKWHAYIRWFDRMARGNAGLVLFAMCIVLWTLILTGSLPYK